MGVTCLVIAFVTFTAVARLLPTLARPFSLCSALQATVLPSHLPVAIAAASTAIASWQS